LAGELKSIVGYENNSKGEAYTNKNKVWWGGTLLTRLFASESLCARLVAIGKRQAVVKMVDAVG